MILHQINSIKDHNAFVPVKLPIHTSFEKVIKRVYQDYNFTQFVISEPYIVHHHIKRDRTEVIQAREEARQLRRSHTQRPYNIKRPINV